MSGDGVRRVRVGALALAVALRADANRDAHDPLERLLRALDREAPRVAVDDVEPGQDAEGRVRRLRGAQSAAAQLEARLLRVERRVQAERRRVPRVHLVQNLAVQRHLAQGDLERDAAERPRVVLRRGRGDGDGGGERQAHRRVRLGEPTGPATPIQIRAAARRRAPANASLQLEATAPVRVRHHLAEVERRDAVRERRRVGAERGGRGG